jgi:hypothetical protein
VRGEFGEVEKSPSRAADLIAKRRRKASANAPARCLLGLKSKQPRKPEWLHSPWFSLPLNLPMNFHLLPPPRTSLNLASCSKLHRSHGNPSSELDPAPLFHPTNGNFSSGLLLATKRVTLLRMRSKNPSKLAKSARSYPKTAASAKRPENVNPSLIKRGKK